jgi:hypothetical protein
MKTQKREEKQNNVKLEMRDHHCMLRNVSKSFWSFLYSPDIQQAFTFTARDWIPESPGYPETKVPSDGFVDAFMDLVLYINTCPPGTPVTVEWNKTFPATFIMVNLRFSRLLLICRKTFHSPMAP